MKVILKNNRVIKKVQDTNDKGIPLKINWESLEPKAFYHLGTFVHEVFEDHVTETRTVTPYPLDYCKGLVKEELRVQRVANIASGFTFENNEYHSDNDSLVMIQLLPTVVPAFKHKNGWTSFDDTTAFKLAGEAHVQNFYGIEAQESMKVDAMVTFEEIVEYYKTLVAEDE